MATTSGVVLRAMRRAVACMFILLASSACVDVADAQDVSLRSVQRLPAQWRDAIARRRVTIEASGVGDWDHEDDTRRALQLTRTDARSVEDAQVSLAIDGDRCATAMRALRDHAPVRRIGRPGLEVVIAFGRVGRGARTFAAIDPTLCAPVSPQDRAASEVAVLSLVGPVLTTSTWTGANRAGGPPYSDWWWSTIDVRTGAPVSLVEFVDEQSVLEAIRSDTFVREHLAEALPELAVAGRLDDAIAILARAGGAAPLDRPAPFAIVDWEPESGTAGVRLAIPSRTCGMCPNHVVALGLRVRPRASFIPHLRAAARGEGHLLRRGEIASM